jgi:hypothetical protein
VDIQQWIIKISVITLNAKLAKIFLQKIWWIEKMTIFVARDLVVVSSLYDSLSPISCLYHFLHLLFVIS